jgi:hypothetical protein
VQVSIGSSNIFLDFLPCELDNTIKKMNDLSKMGRHQLKVIDNYGSFRIIVRLWARMTNVGVADVK